MLATYLSAVLALLLLWNVYPKDFDYGAAAGNGLLFYNANVGPLLSLSSQSMLPCSADITLCTHTLLPIHAFMQHQCHCLSAM